MAGDDVHRAIRDRVAGCTGAYADHVLMVPDLFLPAPERARPTPPQPAA